MGVKGNIQIKGDWGNPSGTGIGKIVVENLPDEVHATLEARLAAFHAALVTGQLTGTNCGECSVTYGDDASANKPANDANIDRKIVATWKTTTDPTVRRITISGVLPSSTAVEYVDSGERLNITGRGVLAAALETLFSLAVDSVVVIQGKVVQKV